MPDLPYLGLKPKGPQPVCTLCACDVVWHKASKRWRHKSERWPFGIPSTEDFSEHKPEVSTDEPS